MPCRRIKFTVAGEVMKQCAKKVMSVRLVLVDFAFGLVNFVLNLPDRPVKFFEEGIVRSILTIKTCLGLVEMTFGLVNASFNLSKWQAVKQTFSPLCEGSHNTRQR